MVFIPDPAALDEGTHLLRTLTFPIRLADGEIILPRVRIEHRASKSAFRIPRRRRYRRDVPLRRSLRWAFFQTMKLSFSRKIRAIVVMVAGTRGHHNLTLWRDPNNLMIWHGECQDCHQQLWVGPGYWKARPGTLKFRGMLFVESCPVPNEIRRVQRRPTAPPVSPFARLLAGRR